MTACDMLWEWRSLLRNLLRLQLVIAGLGGTTHLLLLLIAHLCCSRAWLLILPLIACWSQRRRWDHSCRVIVLLARLSASLNAIRALRHATRVRSLGSTCATTTLALLLTHLCDILWEDGGLLRGSTSWLLSIWYVSNGWWTALFALLN